MQEKKSNAGKNLPFLPHKCGKKHKFFIREKKRKFLFPHFFHAEKNLTFFPHNAGKKTRDLIKTLIFIRIKFFNCTIGNQESVNIRLFKLVISGQNLVNHAKLVNNQFLNKILQFFGRFIRVRYNGDGFIRIFAFILLPKNYFQTRHQIKR